MPRACVLSLLTVLAALTAGPAEARCRRAILEAARTADPRLARREPAAAVTPERELGAGAGSDPARDSGISADGLAPRAPRASKPGGGTASSPEADPPRYSVAPGETLRTVLARWAEAGGWQLVWDSPQDYSLSSSARFPGDFPAAAAGLLESLRSNGAPYGAELYNGNRVIRVTRVR